MLSTLPRLIGHRGAKESAPENTLASIREAARQGAVWVEIDVALTRDGVPVVIHDDTLERTTSGRGALAAIDWAELRALDAGSWFGAPFAGEPVPHFEALLDLVLDLDLGLNAEIKPTPGRSLETAETAINTLKRRWPADRPLLVSSFQVDCLELARTLAPEIPRGYLMDRPPADWAAIADRIGAATLNVNQKRQTAVTVAAYRASGRPVLAYTVNDAVRAKALFDWGVAAVFTDAPGRLAEQLGRL
ncbi:glycerophosphoryl diester phosphodiesterase [Azospirillum sp. TSO22-1]|uniref:glycerophosphoryl diester phosphodiesterase n=1 Tax=Azospirillum sp. TSO22-1 TaxID=716789 RepID=UPI000D60853D|nr:glycerophosphoryl diester phosphodiesterase [Azospirillum sp. TSO22-1]PWC54196.1 glycerophosphodiester phosphodiesterase [Azospirillum sp. TSO22-1]